MGTQARTTTGGNDDLRELGDPEFFRHWSDLRQRVALAGKSVSCDLKRMYADLSAEYRRRIDGESRTIAIHQNRK
jgi:hypothetical protein